jgi:hypothetical protein
MLIKTRLCLVLMALVVGFCFSTSAQSPTDGVIITGDVTKVVFCNQQDDLWEYKITIRLHAKNVGAQPVIISAANGMTDFYKIANTLEDLQAKGYAHLGWVTAGRPGDPKSVPSSPVKPFRIVPPNASIDINLDLGAMVIGELKPGPTYIQVVAENWPDYSEAYTEKIRRAWKSHGILWAHSLHPEPIAFEMPSSVKRAQCL